MRVLLLCHTFFQVIFAIQLRRTRFADAQADIVLSDHTPGMDRVADALRGENCFGRVFFAPVRALDAGEYRKPRRAMLTAAKILGLSGGIPGIRDIRDRYDEFIYYNFNSSSVLLYGCLARRNPALRCSRMEECILSYRVSIHDGRPENLPRTVRWTFRARHLLGKRNLPEAAETFYCFYPRFYAGPLRPVGIDLIDPAGGMPDILARVFRLRPQAEAYREKYLFFASVGDFEGGAPIGEYALAEKIAALVGKENLLIKQHPRDRRTLYRDNGFHLDHNTGIPWEVVQLCRDFSGHVLLTATSSAVLSASLICAGGPEAWYLYPLCDLSGNPTAASAAAVVRNVLDDPAMAESTGRVRVARRLEDIVG